jgi:hypothetical protein
VSVEKLAIDKIRMDGGTQPRAKLSDAVVDDYAQAMLDGVEFPPVDVYYDGTDYWLADGFHRIRAAQKADLAELGAEIHQGTVADAQWHSFAANKAHGLPRSNEDKEKTIRAALRHPKAVGLSNSEVARHLGVSDKTVGKYRCEMESSSEIPKMDQRTVTRGDSTYQQNTANIGGSQRVRPPTLPPPPAQQPQRPGGNSPRPMTATHGPGSPVPMLSISLPLNNPQMGAASMFERFNRDYLRLLVRELNNLLSGETSDRQ